MWDIKHYLVKHAPDMFVLFASFESFQYNWLGMPSCLTWPGQRQNNLVTELIWYVRDDIMYVKQ